MQISRIVADVPMTVPLHRAAGLVNFCLPFVRHMIMAIPAGDCLFHKKLPIARTYVNTRSHDELNFQENARGSYYLILLDHS